MNLDQVQVIPNNIEIVQTRIHQAAARSGRNSQEIKLVAVTKQKSAAVIKTLVENGIGKIGESYLNEATFKIEILDDFEIEWHMIGNIQRGKERKITELFDVVHSIGSKRTALEINRYAQKYGMVKSVYLELNVSGEDTKQGWDARTDQEFLRLLPDLEEIVSCQYLNVVGLMTMAPYAIDPEEARPYFRRMREIREKLPTVLPGSQISELSMGMSGDFEVAVEEGATVVRIGSALVGSR